MKILVPTDFSIYADYAFNAALLFAEKLNAEIHLYNSADIPDDWEDLKAFIRYLDTDNKKVALKVRNQLKKLKWKAEAKGLVCKYHYTGGKFLKNITEITDKIDFDLIIMGSHGVSGKEEWFIGSNTQKVLRKLHKNVLVVKQELTALDFSKVLFVTGLDQEDKEAFRRFLAFIEPFQPKEIHIMTVDTAGFFTQPSIVVKSALNDFKAIAEGQNVKTHFYADFTIDAGIRHFTEEFSIDLVAISNHVRHPLKRIFVGSNVEMIANHLDAPLLVIDY